MVKSGFRAVMLIVLSPPVSLRSAEKLPFWSVVTIVSSSLLLMAIAEFVMNLPVILMELVLTTAWLVGEAMIIFWVSGEMMLGSVVGVGVIVVEMACLVDWLAS